ncbi:MAG: threonine synthase [Sulfurimonas sp.]|jgi:threonine synthase|nr:threonine synthase [Sulfurimonadaceae bacterium]
MKFIQTRGNDELRASEVTFSEAILNPIASFGGLYAPKQLPFLGEEFLQKHLNSSYKELAYDLLSVLDIDVDGFVLKDALALYDKFDNPKEPVPVVKVKDDLFISELYHGPTRAFKDMALQPFGVVLSSLAKKRGENYLILAATSGDTGPAALETFKNRDGVRVACLYPDGGTSDVQRLQMVTESAKNLKVIGINGVFDDAQNALKKLLASDEFKAKLKEKNTSLSAANSVNFGRIIFQIIYHIHSYLELVRQKAITMGEKVYLNVPSGNFGNALGAYYAWKMGLFVEKIIISSNENNVLTRLIKTGKYDLRGLKVQNTTSPAMDILKSSNIERVLFDLFGSQRTYELMLSLDEKEYYELSAGELKILQESFDADFCSDSEGKEYIKEMFYKHNYLLDPHTATCLKSYESCSKDGVKTIAYSTAEWTKFSPVIANALTGEENSKDLDALVSISKEAKLAIPSMIKELFSKEVVQKTVIDKELIESEILKFI